MYNIHPDLWGPGVWKFLHYVAFSYPESPLDEDKENIKQFLLYLGKILPCEKCRNHFKGHIANRPLTNDILNSRYNFIKWTIDLHNDVNRMNKKKELTFDEVVDIYINPKKQSFLYYLGLSPEIINIILLILLIFFIILYLKMNK